MLRIVLHLVVLLFAGLARADPLPIAEVAKRYGAVRSYCETGKVIDRSDGANFRREQSFSLCADASGRFRLVLPDAPHDNVAWSEDGRTGHTMTLGVLQQTDLRRDIPAGIYALHRAPVAPVSQSRLFAAPGHPPELDRPSPLADFVARPDLSSASESVYERPSPALDRGVQRLWVRNADGAMVRSEFVRPTGVVTTVELASVQLDPALGPADFRYTPPLTVRYSLSNRPAVFLATLLSASVAVALVLWTLAFAGAQDVQRVVRWRSRWWRVLRWSGLVAGGLLGVLFVSTLVTPDHGHPPAIVLVLLLAAWVAAAAVLLVACTAASYPVQWLWSRRSSRPARR